MQRDISKGTLSNADTTKCSEFQIVIMEKPQAQHAEYSDGTQLSSAPNKTGAGGIVSEVPTESGLRIREDGHVSGWLSPSLAHKERSTTRLS